MDAGASCQLPSEHRTLLESLLHTWLHSASRGLLAMGLCEKRIPSRVTRRLHLSLKIYLNIVHSQHLSQRTLLCTAQPTEFLIICGLLRTIRTGSGQTQDTLYGVPSSRTPCYLWFVTQCCATRFCSFLRSSFTFLFTAAFDDQSSLDYFGLSSLLRAQYFLLPRCVCFSWFLSHFVRFIPLTFGFVDFFFVSFLSLLERVDSRI